MLSCSRQVAWDMESRCYPGQSLIWTSASEKTHMTHGVCARKQFAWNQWNERHKHCVNLYFCTNTWLLELKTPEQAEGVNKWFAKTEMRREWEAMNTAPDRHHEPHGGTNVCYSLFWSSHGHIIPTQIHRNTQDNFFGSFISCLLLPFLKPDAAPSEDFLHRIKSGDRWNY